MFHMIQPGFWNSTIVVLGFIACVHHDTYNFLKTLMPTVVCLLRCDVLYFLRSSIFCGTVCYFTNGTIYSFCVCDDKQCLHVNLSLWLLRESLWMLPSHVTFDGVLLTCYIPGFWIHLTNAWYYCFKLLLGNWRGTLNCIYNMMPVSHDIFASIYQCEFTSLIAFVDLHELMLVPSDIVASIYLWKIYAALRFVYVHHFCTQWHCRVNSSLENWRSPSICLCTSCLYPVTLSRQFILEKFTQPFALFMYMMPVPSDIVASIYLGKIYAAFRFLYVHDASTQWHCRVYLSLEKLRGPSSLCIYMMSISWDIFASDYHWEMHVDFLLY